MLLLVNAYGLTQDIRPPNLMNTDFRFERDMTLDFETTMKNLPRLDGESDRDYARRITPVISQGLAHIHWKEESDTRKYNQLVPIWENYFLYFMGIASGIPEFEKYHYADYERSLRRGIGICGDAAMIMSQLLDKEGISNHIVNFPGHVVVEVRHSDGTSALYDPDFGVYIPHSITEIQDDPELASRYYLEAGYTRNDADFFEKSYVGGFKRWNGVSHFITKKYYFEKMAYALKWPLPILMIVVPSLVLRSSRPTTSARDR